MNVINFKWVVYSSLLLECANLFIFMGYFNDETEYGFFRGLQPMTYILVACFCISKTKISDSFQLSFLFAIFFISIFNLNTGRSVDMKMMITGFILPIFFTNYLLYFNSEEYKMIARKAVISFYCIVCILAIIERVLSATILVPNIGATEDGFRSWSLCGHPLSNALLISIAMSFILLSDIERKFELFFLGMVSLLCFNTRSSMMFWAVAIIMYYFYLLKSHNNISQKYFRYLFFALVAVTILMLYFGFGDRIIKMGAYDESSASVRVNIFNIFDYYSLSYFKFGYTSEDIEVIQYTSGIHGMIIENYWLLFLLRFGYIFTTILFYFIISFLWKSLKGRSLFDKFFITAAFLLISSTNNSLSQPNNGFLMFFVLCSFAFDNNSYDSKY